LGVAAPLAVCELGGKGVDGGECRGVEHAAVPQDRADDGSGLCDWCRGEELRVVGEGGSFPGAVFVVGRCVQEGGDLAGDFVAVPECRKRKRIFCRRTLGCSARWP
jgi:hypothetical protein